MLYIYIHYIYIYITVCVCVYIYTYIYILYHISIYRSIHTHTHTHTHKYICIDLEYTVVVQGVNDRNATCLYCMSLLHDFTTADTPQSSRALRTGMSDGLLFVFTTCLYNTSLLHREYTVVVEGVNDRDAGVCCSKAVNSQKSVLENTHILQRTPIANTFAVECWSLLQ